MKEANQQSILDTDVQGAISTSGTRSPFQDAIDTVQPTQNAKEAESNPFQEAIAKVQSDKEGGSLKSFGTGVKEGLTQAGLGMMQNASELGAPLDQEATEQRGEDLRSQVVDSRARMDKERERHPLASSLGEFVGSTAPYAATGGGLVGSLGKKMLTSALAGLGIGAAQPTTTNSPVKEKLPGMVMGLGLGAAMPGVIAGGKALRGLLPKRKALSNLDKKFTDISTDELQQSVDSFAKKGVIPTPGEAAGGLTGASRRADEARNIINPKQQSKVIKKLTARNMNLDDQISKAKEALVPKGIEAAEAEAASLYKKVGPVTVSREVEESLLSDSLIKGHIDKAGRRVNLKLDDTKSGTIGWWDTIKKSIDKDLAKPSTSTAERANLLAAKSKIVTKMDNIDPNYKLAREQAQRSIVYKKFEVAESKIISESGADKATPDQIYKAMWGTPKKQAEYIDMIKQTGGDVESAKTLLAVLNKVKGGPLGKLSLQDTSTKLTGTVDSAPSRGLVKGVQNWYKKAMTDLTVSDKWLSDLKRIRAIKDGTHQRNEFYKLLEIVALRLPRSTGGKLDTVE